MSVEIVRGLTTKPPFHVGAMCQIWLLVGVRMIINMARVSVGPLMVAMMADFKYSIEERGEILSAFSAGYSLTQIAGGLAAERSGSAPVLSMSLLSASFGMLFLPTAASCGVNALWCLLFVAGILQGPVFAAMQVSFSRWASGSLASYASMLANAGTTMGSVVGLGITPFLINLSGWQSTARVLGVLCIVFTTAFTMLAHSSPMQKDEIFDSTATKAAGDIVGDIHTSLFVLSRLPVHAIFVAHIGSNFLRNFYMSWMPTYCSEVLAMSGTVAGACLILPEVVAVVCGMVVARTSRSLQEQGILSVLSNMRLFTLGGTIGTSVALVTMRRITYVPTVVVCLCVIQVFASIVNSGYSANYAVITKYHSGLVSGVGNTVASLGSYFAPKLASAILADEASPREERWASVFLMVAMISAMASLFYIANSSADAVDVYGFKKDD